MNLRKAIAQDASDIAEIHILGWQSAYRGLFPDSYLDQLSIPKRMLQWQEWLKQSPVCVLEENHEILGFISFGAHNENDSDSLTVGEVFAIYVKPGLVHKGIGSLLMNTALEKMNEMNFKKVALWVLEENKSAIKFYEKHGFQLTQKRKNQEKVPDIFIFEALYQREL